MAEKTTGTKRSRLDPAQKAAATQARALGARLPAGLELDTDEARLLWVQITKARLPDDWRTVDLLLVHRLVQVEIRLRDLWAIYDVEGPTVVTDSGRVVTNPLLKALSILHQQQMQLMTRLGLMTLIQQTADEINARGQAGERMNDAQEQTGTPSTGVESLLAAPAASKSVN